MPSKLFRFAWLAVLVLGAGMACNLFTNLQGANNARQTAGALVTQVEGLGEGLEDEFGTVQAIATEEGSQGLATLQAVGTEIAESGFLETAQAELPADGEELLATLNAVATQGINLDFGPNLPADIPLVDETTITNRASSEGYISYQTSLDYPTTVAFYKQEMPANGWTALPESFVETEDTTILYFEKENRNATVSMIADSVTNLTTVQVVLTED
jgi:hypothetical protein